MKYKKIIFTVLVLLCFATIFMFSSQDSKESNGLSNKLIVKTYEIIHRTKLDNKEKNKIINKYNYLIRKSAHVVIYLILGVLVICLLYCFNIDKRIIIYSLLICFIYALTDEFHQKFTSRTASFIDVLIDTSGSSLGIITTYFLFIRKRIINKK